MFTKLIEKDEKIKKAKDLAKSHGGECLSEEYFGALTKLKLKCNKNHIWESTYNNFVNNKRWCKMCSHEKSALRYKNSNGLLDAKEYAVSRGGECLSNEYINYSSKLKWKCAKGHLWESSYASTVNNKGWCPNCAGKISKIETLENIKNYAILNGGECLSNEYVNSSTKLKWKCSKGHLWESSYASTVNNKRWCKICSFEQIGNKNRNHNGFEQAKQYAISKGGLCLSEKYISNHKKLKWRCANKHEWEAVYSNVLNAKTWCPICANLEKSIKSRNGQGLKQAIEHAKSKGGECLSSEYVNSKSKLKWRCANKHEWESTYKHVLKRDAWCPICAVYYYKEHKIRNLLNYLLDTNFEKVRPEWNVNPKTNKALELDGYSEELKIAFEFQGLHHYEEGVFLNSKEDLEYIQYKDKIKKENCIDKNIKLLIIDDKINFLNTKIVLDYILKILKENNIEILINIDISKVENILKEHTNHQEKYFKEAQNYAISRGGKCLSDEYINSKSKMKWECESNHIWESSYEKVVATKHWCPICKYKTISKKQSNKKGLEIAQEYAASKGGLCLSNEYINNSLTLKWKCEKNHIWEASYANTVSSKKWCPKCAGKFSKDELLSKAKKHAEEKKGLCLSTEYINNSSYLKWVCKESHVWEGSYKNVVYHDKWCPKCAKENLI